MGVGRSERAGRAKYFEISSRHTRLMAYLVSRSLIFFNYFADIYSFNSYTSHKFRSPPLSSSSVIGLEK